MRGASCTSGQGQERQPRYRARAALAAKIGFNHALVGLDDARAAFGQLLAVVEDEHRLAESHHHLHVVLYEKDGFAAIAQGAYRVQQIVQQGAVDAGRSLVEEDELGIGHEDTHELHELLLAVGEIAREFAGEALELDEGEQLLGPRPRRRVVVGGNHEEILQRGQLGEDADHLEGAADALVEDPVRLEPVQAPALEADLSLVDALHPRDAVEERGLARAVRPDEPVDVSRLQRERHAVDGGDAAESLHHAIHHEDGLHQMVRGRLYFCWSTPRMPRGMRRTTVMMMAPKRSWWR